MCLSILRQGMPSEGTTKNFKIPHDLWVKSITCSSDHTTPSHKMPTAFWEKSYIFVIYDFVAHSKVISNHFTCGNFFFFKVLINDLILSLFLSHITGILDRVVGWKIDLGKTQVGWIWPLGPAGVYSNKVTVEIWCLLIAIISSINQTRTYLCWSRDPKWMTHGPGTGHE